MTKGQTRAHALMVACRRMAHDQYDPAPEDLSGYALGIMAKMLGSRADHDPRLMRALRDLAKSCK